MIRYNATDKPFRQASLSQYHFPNAKERYITSVKYLNLICDDQNTDKIELLIKKIEQLKQAVDIPHSLKDALPEINEKTFLAAVDIMAEHALDDQCTETNPRAPLLDDLKKLYLEAYYGTAID